MTSLIGEVARASLFGLDVAIEAARQPLFSERQHRTITRAPSAFLHPSFGGKSAPEGWTWSKTAELVGESGRHTLLGYLAEREKLLEKQPEPTWPFSIREPGDFDRVKYEPRRLLGVELRDPKYPYFDTRSEDQKTVDEVEEKLHPKKRPNPEHSFVFSNSWQHQGTWYVDPATGEDSTAVTTTPVSVPMGRMPSATFINWEAFSSFIAREGDMVEIEMGGQTPKKPGDKTHVEEFVSSAKGESPWKEKSIDK